VQRAELDLSSYADPVGGWSTSLANVAEVMVPCIELTGARSVAEIGAYSGDLTRMLVDWASRTGGRVLAIDPAPRSGLLQLDEECDELELVRETSANALPGIELTDVVIIDGDHNWWTVSEELRLIAERASGAELPLLLFHDVGWPHAFRDDYFAAEQIPEEYRHPIAGPDESRGLYPGDPGLRPGGLPYPRSAAREGGPRNGVRRAVEDFVAAHEGLGFARVPAFFGFGVVWHRDAPWAERLTEFLEHWDENPVIARLEANRVRLLADMHVQATELWKGRERRARQEAVLRRLLESSAFALAERLSRLRIGAGVGKGSAAISKDEIRRALGDC
jgi:Methyltransferase domain